MSEEKKVFRMARYTYDAWRELREKDFDVNGFDDKEEEYPLDEEDITELPFPIAWDDEEYDEDDVEDEDDDDEEDIFTPWRQEYWAEKMCPGHTITFVEGKFDDLKAIDILPRSEFDHALIVTLDQEYLDWLKDKPDTTENRIQYMSGISEEKATYLLHKSELDYEANWCFLLISAYFRGSIRSTRTTYHLDENTQNDIQRLMEEHFPGADIWVTPYLFSADSAHNSGQLMAQLSHAFLHGNERPEVKGAREQRWRSKKSMRIGLAIPIIIGKRLESAAVPLEYKYERDVEERLLHPTMYYFDEDIENDEDDDWMDEDTGWTTPKAFVKAGIVKDLENIIAGSQVTIYERLVDEGDIGYLLCDNSGVDGIYPGDDGDSYLSDSPFIRRMK